MGVYDTTTAGLSEPPSKRWSITKMLSGTPVELRGVMPVLLEDRTSTQFSSYFTLWFCMNVNLLPITFGLLGPMYGLNLRDSALTILFFVLLTAAIPAYLGTLGPKTGLRQMIQARYSFGRYIVSIPIVLNVATLVCFCVIGCVVASQCLSAVAGGQLSVAVGVVVVGIVGTLVSFCGYRVLHHYERWASIPALVCFAVVAGCGGPSLGQQAPTEPATAAAVLSFGMNIASYMIPYGAIASDFTTYLSPKVPTWRLFLYGYAGLVIPAVLLMTLGAAMGGALPSIPEWQQGYDTTDVGGVLAAMLTPAGGFGKFVVVVLSLTLIGNLSATMYAITLNFQILVPQLMVVPRYVFSIIVAAIVIPVSVTAADNFYGKLQYFIALIVYWSAAFVAVVIVEHLVFRRRRHDAYDPDSWNAASRLPWGAAALAASALSFGLVVPSIAQTGFTGPIAQYTGDIGFEMAMAVTAVLYVPLRALEKRLSGR